MATGALLALTACGTVEVGSDFDLQAFTAGIQHRVTKKSNLQEMLGKPASKGVVVNTDGQRLEKWTWYYGYGRVSRMEQASLKYLEVQFDTDGRVAAYNWSQ